MALKEKGHLEITKELLEFFHTGRKTLDIFLNPEAGRDQWELHKDKVIADWIKNRPGSRPWTWWEYDSPDHPKSFKPINFDEVMRNYIRWGVTHKPGPETFPEPPYLFESEAAYLKRKKLLVNGELQRIKPGAFEPKEFYPFFKLNRFKKYSRIDDYSAILEKTRARMKEGGSVDISTYGLPESKYSTRFKI